jgi:hypothetical protein
MGRICHYDPTPHLKTRSWHRDAARSAEEPDPDLAIHAWGLPLGHPEDSVPHAAAQFAAATLNLGIGTARGMARARGFAPDIHPLPVIGADVWSFYLTVGAAWVPFMVRLKPGSAPPEAGDEDFGEFSA